jgi:hypothetical protein
VTGYTTAAGCVGLINLNEALRPIGIGLPTILYIAVPAYTSAGYPCHESNTLVNAAGEFTKTNQGAIGS